MFRGATTDDFLKFLLVGTFIAERGHSEADARTPSDKNPLQDLMRTRCELEQQYGRYLHLRETTFDSDSLFPSFYAESDTRSILMFNPCR